MRCEYGDMPDEEGRVGGRSRANPGAGSPDVQGLEMGYIIHQGQVFSSRSRR